MDGDLGIVDAEPNDAESAKEYTSKYTPTYCEDNRYEYQLECTKCKRLDTTNAPLFQPSNFVYFLKVLPRIHVLPVR